MKVAKSLPDARLKKAICDYHEYRNRCDLAGEPASNPIDKINEFAVFSLIDESYEKMKKNGYCNGKNGLVVMHSRELMREIEDAVRKATLGGKPLTRAGFARALEKGTDNTDCGNSTRTKAGTAYLTTRVLRDLWDNWMKFGRMYTSESGECVKFRVNKDQYKPR